MARVLVLAAVLSCILLSPSHAEFALALGEAADTKWWVGWTTDQPTQDAADAEARSKCRAGGAPDCRILTHGRDTCFSLAIAKNAPVYWAYAKRSQIPEAEKVALDICQKKQAECSIVISKCDGNGLSSEADIDSNTRSAYNLSLIKNIRKCFILPSFDYPDNMFVKIDLKLNPDGTLAGEPVVMEGTPHKGAAKYVASIIDALKKCSPFLDLPIAKYDAWKRLLLDFKISELR